MNFENDIWVMLSCCLIEMKWVGLKRPFREISLMKTVERVYPHIKKRKKRKVDMFLYVYIKIGL